VVVPSLPGYCFSQRPAVPGGVTYWYVAGLWHRRTGWLRTAAAAPGPVPRWAWLRGLASGGPGSMGQQVGDHLGERVIHRGVNEKPGGVN
jgi:hypothetical protein